MLRTGEEVISEVREIIRVNENISQTEECSGYHLHKPFRLDIVESGMEDQTLTRVIRLSGSPGHH